MDPFNLDLIVDGEVIDTYGGDYTHRDIYHDPTTGIFYEYTYGAKGTEEYEQIFDQQEIDYYKTLID